MNSTTLKQVTNDEGLNQ